MSIVDKLRNALVKKDRFAIQMQRIKAAGKQTDLIEETVNNSIKNLRNKKNSFIIYGEPQSGKTEMMICLTAKLLDENYKIIILLINDNVHLRNQNLFRFIDSKISPSPVDYTEILHPDTKIGSSPWVIFCKKNGTDLKKLLDKIDSYQGKIIIDDEADYATPNSKVNNLNNEKSTINDLIGRLLDEGGAYIGVTATPGPLDLNKTFDNIAENWIEFKAHDYYHGFETFFPNNIEKELSFHLNLLPDVNDSPIYILNALYRFIINVSYLNSVINEHEECYSMLIHTSGTTVNHEKDYIDIQKAIRILNNEEDTNFEKKWDDLAKVAEKMYPNNIDSIMQYAWQNLGRNKIVKMNNVSKKEGANYDLGTNPAAPFTIAIGGNIVSRGVTFENLLTMYFTRDASKIQQDTYIQRARMFGTRGKYIKYFELHIPEYLYDDWARCFLFHKLSLESIRSSSVPSWVGDQRINPIAKTKIDKRNIDFQKGEMSFEKFTYDKEVKEIEARSDITMLEKLNLLRDHLGDQYLPIFLLNLIQYFMPHKDKSIVWHHSTSIANYGSGTDQDNISRPKSFLGARDLEGDKYPDAIHHFKILYNADNVARMFYKFEGRHSIIRNVKHIKR
jgi:hypothetical protein